MCTHYINLRKANIQEQKVIYVLCVRLCMFALLDGNDDDGDRSKSVRMKGTI